MSTMNTTDTTAAVNADPAEVGKFDALAQRWWDPNGEFGPLHRLNPLRLGYVQARAPLAGRRVLDVGCGGGILSESMARTGAHVLGIDLAAAALQVAELHALEQDVAVAYRRIAAEELAAEVPGAFDVVTCMEMLEHVPDPPSVLAALARLVRPGGDVFVSTINRNAKAFLMTIVGAEYVLRMLPRGTHDYERFIRPSELARAARAAGLQVVDFTGMVVDPFTREFRLGPDVSVNYLAHLRRPVEAA
jgi:2-polyprenyl-6-hydroxyphenyl methylase/3-demethylubiquinone-9 3-methyltransferase